MSESEVVLALDLGMSRISAAIASLAPSGKIDTRPFVLGHGGSSVAALVFVTDDGALLFGDAAEQRGFARPERLIRGFTHRVGDEVPLMAGDRSATAEDLTAHLVRWAVEMATHREGRRPVGVVLTHPSSWTAHRTAALRVALAEAGIDDAALMTSAEAVAHHHDASHPLQSGDTIAVYDLGGSSFEGSIVRREAEQGFRLLGDPAAMTDLGGTMFDDALLNHAITTAGISLASLPSSTETHVALARLRRACIAAKEALSFDAEAAIPVTLPGHSSGVRITRSEVEAMIDPALELTLEALEQSIESAHRTPEQLELILLVGGSANIPLVAQRLSERFDRPLVAAPDAAAALGAARAEMRRLENLWAASPVEPSGDTDEPQAMERPHLRLLPAFRPAFARASIRSAAPAVITIAAVIVTAGVAASAAGIVGVGDHSSDDGGIAASAPGSGSGPGFLTHPFDLLLTEAEEASTSTPPNAANPSPRAPADEVEQTTPHRRVVDRFDDSRSPTPPSEWNSRRGPQLENASPAEPPRSSAPRSSTTRPKPAPSSPAPKPTRPPSSGPTSPPTPPPSDPQPVDPVAPPADPPPADPAPTDPPSSEPPPTDPAPADPPAPVEQPAPSEPSEPSAPPTVEI